jgi:predicted proteasome-type protease
MTPKEKAKELIDKFLEIGQPYGASRIPRAKQCALIAVDEILQANLSTGIDTDKMIVDYEYWQEVKNEIEKL